MRYILILFAFFTVHCASAQDSLMISQGKQLFKANCKSCHNIDQNLVGPALKGVHERRDSAWIYSFVKNSTAIIESNDSTAVALFNKFNKVLMPPQKINDGEIASILAYIKDAGTARASDAPFARPADPKIYHSQLHFDSFFFWIFFTLAVIALILLLYYLTVHYDYMSSINT